MTLQEVFQGSKYKMSVEEDGFVHKLTISNPTTADMGKYTCDINNLTTSAYLDVEGKDSMVETFYVKVNFISQKLLSFYQDINRVYTEGFFQF